MFAYQYSIETHDLLDKYNFNNCIIIDVRTPLEYAQCHIPRSLNIPHDFLLQKPMLYLNKFYTYYIICKNGTRSQHACQELLRQNYNVLFVNGGLNAWNGPLEKDRCFS